jgi:F-type H+-transporting ATPase subunit gamma
VSDTVASLGHQITNAHDVHSVVRAMKALAASNIGQYRTSLRAVSEYSRTVELGLGACLRDRRAGKPSADAGRAARRVEVIVFGSDQGLVGNFNDAVAEEALKAIHALGQRARVWAVGERVRGRLVKAGATIAGLWPVPDSVAGIAPVVGQILVACEAPQLRGSLTEVHVFYNRLGAGDTCAPVSERVLPLDDAWRAQRIARPWPDRSLPEVIGGAPTLRAFVRAYVFVSLFKACAESLASENASRLAAMDRADKNIKDLLETLDGSFHRVRQASIDEELFDVVAGFEAVDAETQRAP